MLSKSICSNVPTFITYKHRLFFSPELYSGSSTILLHVRPIVCVFGCFSQIFTAVLAVTRLLSVIMPFLHLRQKYIFGYITIHILYMIVANMTYYGIDAFYAKEDLTELLVSVMKTMEDVCFWSYFLHCMVGVLASMVTFLYLLVERGRNPTTADKYLRSSITLLLMNNEHALHYYHRPHWWDPMVRRVGAQQQGDSVRVGSYFYICT